VHAQAQTSPSGSRARSRSPAAGWPARRSTRPCAASAKASRDAAARQGTCTQLHRQAGRAAEALVRAVAARIGLDPQAEGKSTSRAALAPASRTQCSALRLACPHWMRSRARGRQFPRVS
jgi:hypothetical protein